MSTDDPRDRSLDDAYRATGRDEPPRELDERILAAAHRAVEARPMPIRRSFAQRWRVPVALAATVVLSATVTLMVYETEKAPPLPESRSSNKVREESVSPAASGVLSAPGKPAAAPEAKPARAETQTAAPQPNVPADEVGAARTPAAPAQAGALRQSRPQETENVEKRTAPEAAPAPSLSRERAFGDRPSSRGDRESAAAGAAQPALQSAEDWIAEIRRLKEAGRTDEANRLLAEFRDRFPGRPLPEDLR